MRAPLLDIFYVHGCGYVHQCLMYCETFADLCTEGALVFSIHVHCQLCGIRTLCFMFLKAPTVQFVLYGVVSNSGKCIYFSEDIIFDMPWGRKLGSRIH